MIRVAIVDDQQLVREGFDLILRSQPDLEVATATADGRAFLDAVRADPRIDVALVDIRMPVLDGLAATRALASIPHAPAVIVVTTFETTPTFSTRSQPGLVVSCSSGAPPGSWWQRYAGLQAATRFCRRT